MSANRRGLFRDEALARRGQREPIDGLLRVTAPHEWAVLVGLGLVLAAVSVWAVFGSVERSLAADCVLAQRGERYAVLSGVAGYVTEVLAAPGDPVTAGRPLARIATPDARQRAALARARIAALEAEGQADELARARAELLELEAMEEYGDFIVSPYSGIVVSHTLAPGRAVIAGAEVAQVLDSADPGWDAVALLPPDRAHGVPVGMAAQVTTAGPNLDGAQTLNAWCGRGRCVRLLHQAGWPTWGCRPRSEATWPMRRCGKIRHSRLRTATPAACGLSCVETGW